MWSLWHTSCLLHNNQRHVLDCVDDNIVSYLLAAIVYLLCVVFFIITALALIIILLLYLYILFVSCHTLNIQTELYFHSSLSFLRLHGIRALYAPMMTSASQTQIISASPQPATNSSAQHSFSVKLTSKKLSHMESSVHTITELPKIKFFH